MKGIILTARCIIIKLQCTGEKEHLKCFKTEYILMTASLLAGSSRVHSTKINICNISEFLTDFIPQSVRSKYLNTGPHC